MTKKRYWKSLAELDKDQQYLKEQKNEFPEKLPRPDGFSSEELEHASSSRRDFLKMLGFSVTAATVAASCEMPVRKSIPYVIKPDDVTPGVANYYASTFAESGDYCSVLVKTREGRPIKIEGNKQSKLTKGGTSAIAQASVLSLYDNHRLKAPSINQEKSTWEAVDKEIIKKLEKIQADGGKIRILSPTIISPTTRQAIADFTTKYPNTEHVTYDPVSYSGMLNANKQTFGKRVIPGYNFDKADLIVSFGADFLGTWISPVEYATQYAKNRKVNKDNPKMSRHIQVESYLSLTGSNADKRIMIKPSEQGMALLHLYNVIASKSNAETTSNLPELDAEIKNDLARIADELLETKGKSLVVCGSNDVHAQSITNAINVLLENYGKTIDLNNYSNQRQGDDGAFLGLVKGLKNIDALLLLDANPAYNAPDKEVFKAALENIPLTISLNEKLDESASLCQYACPNHHYLESWNDAQPRAGQYSLIQPTIAPLFDTRNAGESLLKWAGQDIPYYNYVKKYWEDNLYSQQTKYTSFNVFWDYAVQDGVFEVTVPTEDTSPSNIDIQAAGSALISQAKTSSGIDLVLYEKVAIRDGKYADNPWLQELPDPVSKMTWDNYAAVSRKFAEENGLNVALTRMEKSVGTDTDVIKVSANGYDLTLPVIIQPGTPDNTIAIALGYGREKGGMAGNHVGKNAYPFIQTKSNAFSRIVSGASMEVLAGETYSVATIQHHHTIYDGLHERHVVKETSLEEYKDNPYAGNEDREEIREHLESLYPGHDEEYDSGHHWGMVVDLNSCIGCSACVIACTAENNVPVVGKKEVRRSREMHWLRIDRYYSHVTDKADPTENPSVIFQPMMCQHCDNAPCENVCPVAATSHNSEGINQMIYNRCFGTRYCANNCPYKVRRFNWFDYFDADSFKGGTVFGNTKDPLGDPLGVSTNNNAHDMVEDLTRMVLNPDVAVRSRGVMEKCSFCVQRIQAGKLTAKKEDRQLTDDDIHTACQQACPTNAIHFGDNNNESSLVSKMAKDERAFKVIEEIHTLPSVSYLTKVRNTKSEV